MGVRPCFVIGGVDYIGSILMQDGIKVSREDLDSEDSQRTMDALMHRVRIGVKLKASVAMIPLVTEEFAALSQAISPETVDIKILNPHTAAQETHSFYCSSIATASMYDDGVDCTWSGGSFNIIEV